MTPKGSKIEPKMVRKSICSPVWAPGNSIEGSWGRLGAISVAFCYRLGHSWKAFSSIFQIMPGEILTYVDISGHMLCTGTLPRLLRGRGIRWAHGMSLSEANHMQSNSNQSNVLHPNSIQSTSIFQATPVLGRGPAAGGEALRIYIYIYI